MVSLQSLQKAGLHLYINVILFESEILGIFFVQFRAFYIKEFTGQKEVANKLFISVRCVVTAKRSDSEH